MASNKLPPVPHLIEVVGPDGKPTRPWADWFQQIFQRVGGSFGTDAVSVATDLAAHIADPTGAHAASAISNVPSGNLSATDVQVALDELQGDSDALDARLDAVETSIANASASVNLGLSSSVASNALTIALKQSDGTSDPGAGMSAVRVGFRSATVTSGAYTQRSATAATSLVVPSGATLGHVSAMDQYVWVYLMDNAGTLELAVSGVKLFDDYSIASSTSISAAATSGTVLYSTTGRSNLPIRLIGRLLSNQSTAGTWASAVSEVALASGKQPKTTIDRTAFTPTIKGITSDPTAGTTAYNSAYYWRDGENLFIQWAFRQTVAGSAGSGTYYIELPNSYAVDTNKINNTNTSGYGGAVGSASLLVNSTGFAGVSDIITGATNQIGAVVGNSATNPASWGSALGALSNTTIEISLTACVPVSGWSTYGP